MTKTRRRILPFGDNEAAGGRGFSGTIYCVSVYRISALGLPTIFLGLMMKFATELIMLPHFFSIGCSLTVEMVDSMLGPRITIFSG